MRNNRRRDHRVEVGRELNQGMRLDSETWNEASEEGEPTWSPTETCQHYYLGPHAALLCLPQSGTGTHTCKFDPT